MSLLQAVTSALAPLPDQLERPCLDLSGPRLTQAFETLLAGSEALGGIECYVEALSLKHNLFQEAFCDCEGRALELATFKALCPFMASVRRRIGSYLEEDKFPGLRDAVGELLAGIGDTTATESRIEKFCSRFPNNKSHRWVRDLAAEVLHNTYPERYPLMCRWVWDRKSNTGVLREIWFADNVDHITIDVPSNYATFLMLREELSQFLTHNGVFNDVMIYIDLICAQVYADYICAQGGSYLRADFSSPDDPMQHARRLLGLDGVPAGTDRTRLKAIDGKAYVIEENPDLIE